TLIEMLERVAAVRPEIDHVQVDTVIRSNIVLELAFQLSDFEVLVGAFPWLCSILGFERIAAAVPRAVLRARMMPSAAAEIFRIRNQPQTIALEKLAVLQ